MGRITLTIGLIFCFLLGKGQNWHDTDTIDNNAFMGVSFSPLAQFKKEISAKIVKKRFYLAAIHKDILESDGYYFIELETDDYKDYFYITLFNKDFIKIWCLPNRLRFMLTEYIIEFE